MPIDLNFGLEKSDKKIFQPKSTRPLVVREKS